MSIQRIFAIAAISLAFTGPVAFAADGGKKLGTFGAWEAYLYTDSAGKMCYAAARADKLQGGDKNRAGAAVAITHRPKSPNEVSVTGPSAFKKDAEVEIQIGGMKYTFFSRGQTAWAKDSTADKSIIAAMVKGKEVTIHGAPAKGSAIVDSVSLKGFGEALSTIDKACGVKRQ